MLTWFPPVSILPRFRENCLFFVKTPKDKFISHSRARVRKSGHK